MRTVVTSTALVMALALCASAATAQDRPRYRRNATAVVDIVDVPTRILELTRKEGYFVRLHVPEGMAGLEAVKVGQTVRVVYNENVILKIQRSGDKDYNREPVTPTASTADLHGNPDLVRKVSGVVRNIDPKFGNVYFTEDNGRLYMARVEKPDVSSLFKAGDKVDITYTQATLVELKEPSN